MIYLSILLFSFGMYGVYRFQTNIHSKKYVIFISFVSLLYVLITWFYLAIDYLTGEGFNEAAWYHLASGISLDLLSEFWLELCIFLMLLLVSIFILICYYKILEFRISGSLNTVAKKSLWLSFSELLLFVSLIINPTVLSVYDFYSDVDIKHDVRELKFEDFYIKPSIKSVTENHPNFVYIYIESFERTFFDESIFPKLAVNLKQLEIQNTSFTNVQQNFSTGWTMAGIVSSQCGIPLMGSDKGYELFYKNAICMSDLLNTQDYHLFPCLDRLLRRLRQNQNQIR